jgi:DNA (cytosine-5)-methyltransferase 1
VEIGAFPEWHDRPPLEAFLRHPGKPLSARATRGFLSRTYRAKLRFPDGFQDRLREHLFIMEGRSSDEFAIAAE